MNFLVYRSINDLRIIGLDGCPPRRVSAYHHMGSIPTMENHIDLGLSGNEPDVKTTENLEETVGENDDNDDGIGRL